MLSEDDRQKLKLYDAQLEALDSLDLPVSEIEILKKPLLAARATILSLEGDSSPNLFPPPNAYRAGDEEASTDDWDCEGSSTCSASPPGSQG